MPYVEWLYFNKCYELVTTENYAAYPPELILHIIFTSALFLKKNSTCLSPPMWGVSKSCPKGFCQLTIVALLFNHTIALTTGFIFIHLHRRTWNRTIAAKYTTVSWFWL